jgi:NAD(P)-dependent dehydrogenase (short-subunit alcohol dehydrogenase family)
MADRKKRQQPRGDAPRDEERQPSRRARTSNGSARAGSTGGRAGTRRQSPEQRVARYEKPPYPKQHQPKPGIEAEMEPRPEYVAPHYRGAGKLDGKTALITGGDSGIGRAVAVIYAREGADVAIVYLPEEQQDAEETREAVEAEGKRCVLIPGDVTDSKFCEWAVEQAVRELGQLDILVNNAAYQQHQESIEDISDEQLEHTFRTNIFGYFYLARAALKYMDEGSAIVNCGSITGLEGSKQLLDYSATKGAIHAFTKSLAQQLVDRGIRVNCVSPGPIWTPLNVADKDAEDVAEHGAETPMKRPGQPEEVAPAFVFFASNADSSYITGEILTLLGGETRAA